METVLTRNDLPCANPHLVAGYVSIERVLRGLSRDFRPCRTCGICFCAHRLDQKRADESYRILLDHFRAGGEINQPIYYERSENLLCNGHHRIVAALDAGYTHVPYSGDWGDDEDWENTSEAPKWPGES